MSAWEEALEAQLEESDKEVRKLRKELAAARREISALYDTTTDLRRQVSEYGWMTNPDRMGK